jgi:hypothetical protein
LPKDELREKNRIAWNRYFAANLENETRARLIEEKRHPMEELTPLSAEELAEIEEAFAKRAGSSATQVLPPFNFVINFSDVQFDNNVYFAEYLFTRVTFFFNATLSGRNYFHGATFCRGALAARSSPAVPTLAKLRSPGVQRLTIRRSPGEPRLRARPSQAGPSL